MMTTRKHATAIFATTLKEQADKATQRAKELGIPIQRSQVMELLAAAYGANNYHEVAPAAKHTCRATIDAQEVDAIQLAKETLALIGSPTISVITNATEPYGDVSYCMIKFTEQDLTDLFLHLFHGGQEPQLESCFDQMGWVNDEKVEFCRTGEIENDVFWVAARHKHSEGYEYATSEPISTKSLLKLLKRITDAETGSLAALLQAEPEQCKQALYDMGLDRVDTTADSTYLLFNEKFHEHEFLEKMEENLKKD